MSITQSTVASSSSTPSPSSTPTTNASTLLFGFLVSALSIFAVFMTGAIVWNRLIARRHAIEAMWSTSLAESPRLRRPMMWDIWTIPDKQPLLWPDVKPVAAQKCDCPPRPSPTRQTEQTTSFWRRHLLNRLPPEITYLFYRPSPPFVSSDADVSQVELSHGSDIQVSLLIAMPRAPQSSTRESVHDNHHVFHESVFATMHILCHDPASSEGRGVPACI